VPKRLRSKKRREQRAADRITHNQLKGQKMRTAAVKRLIELALASLPKPHTEDVIDDVFNVIEHHPEWRQEYDNLCVDLGKTVVNTWGGFWISHSEGRSSVQQVPSRQSTLIASNSKLTSANAKLSKKVKEPAALEAMAAYFQQHKAGHREQIVELLMEGHSAEEAFSAVLANGA
jgi:hypothetical protein